MPKLSVNPTPKLSVNPTPRLSVNPTPKLSVIHLPKLRIRILQGACIVTSFIVTNIEYGLTGGVGEASRFKGSLRVQYGTIVEIRLARLGCTPVVPGNQVQSFDDFFVFTRPEIVHEGSLLRVAVWFVEHCIIAT